MALKTYFFRENQAYFDMFQAFGDINFKKCSLCRLL